MNVKQHYRNAQIALYQKLADFIIQTLQTVKTTFYFGRGLIWE